MKTLIKKIFRKEKELHIKILEYGKNHSEGFTEKEIINDLNLTELQSAFLRDEMRGADIVSRTGKFRNDEKNADNQILLLSFESRFKLLEFDELRQAKNSSKAATFLAILAVSVSMVAVWLQINSNILADKTLKATIDPQIEVYIKRTDLNDKKNFIVGIENNGINSVKNLSVYSSVIQMNKNSFSKGEVDVTAVQGNLFEESEFNPFDQAQTRVIIPNDKQWVGVLYLNVKYTRDVDMKKFNEQFAFFADGFGVYSFEQIKDVPGMESIVKNFKLYSSDHLFDQQFYGQPI